MTHNFIVKKANIFKYPSVRPTLAEEITIGDLHANAMLLMFFLVKNGVVEISPKDYKKLKNIYIKKTVLLSDIIEFNHIIDNLTIKNKPLVRLVGDEVCDRGQNDYFIFKILAKLHKEEVKLDILLSNHGFEFLIPYEQNVKLFSRYIPNPSQVRSLSHMQELLDKGVINKSEVDELITQSYLPNLKLIAYTKIQKTLTIYSHAAIGLETIQALANKFAEDGVIYKDDTIEDLAHTVDEINRVFSKYVKERTVHTLNVNVTSACDYDLDPINFLIWNREYFNLERHKEHKGYCLYYVHGHDSGELSFNNIFNLDSELGKYLAIFDDHHELGMYKSLEVFTDASLDHSPEYKDRESQELELKKKKIKANKIIDNYAQKISEIEVDFTHCYTMEELEFHKKYFLNQIEELLKQHKLMKAHRILAKENYRPSLFFSRQPKIEHAIESIIQKAIIKAELREQEIEMVRQLTAKNLNDINSLVISYAQLNSLKAIDDWQDNLLKKLEELAADSSFNSHKQSLNIEQQLILKSLINKKKEIIDQACLAKEAIRINQKADLEKDTLNKKDLGARQDELPVNLSESSTIVDNQKEEKEPNENSCNNTQLFFSFFDNKSNLSLDSQNLNFEQQIKLL